MGISSGRIFQPFNYQAPPGIPLFCFSFPPETGLLLLHMLPFRKKEQGLIWALILIALPILAQPKIGGMLKEQGNGTVFDLKSELYWQKCSQGQIFNGTTCTGTAVPLTWREGRKYCNRLKLLKRKWRIPTLKELKTISLKTGARPGIDLDIFPGTVPYEYWTSQRFVDSMGLWTHVFSYQSNYEFAVKAGKFYTRCVSSQS